MLESVVRAGPLGSGLGSGLETARVRIRLGTKRLAYEMSGSPWPVLQLFLDILFTPSVARRGRHTAVARCSSTAVLIDQFAVPVAIPHRQRPPLQ